MRPELDMHSDEENTGDVSYRTVPLAIILAAGQGTRMRSSLPKVGHLVAGRPMLHYVLDTAWRLRCDPILVVVGHQAPVVESLVNNWYSSIPNGEARPQVQCVLQNPQQGTGHAVAQCLPFLVGNANWQRPVVILSGDVPLIRVSTLEAMLAYHLGHLADVTVLTANTPHPEGYGRIVRHGYCPDILTAIVEQKDLSPEMANNTEINAGIYIVTGSTLLLTIPKIKNNNRADEYYLTDIVAIAHREAETVMSFHLEDLLEVSGINTPEQLLAVEEQLRQRGDLFAPVTASQHPSGPLGF